MTTLAAGHRPGKYQKDTTEKRRGRVHLDFLSS